MLTQITSLSIVTTEGNLGLKLREKKRLVQAIYTREKKGGQGEVLLSSARNTKKQIH